MSTIEAPREKAARTSKERGGHALERVTVSLTARSAEALDRAAVVTQDSKTDTVNRALQTYAYFVEVVANGGTISVRESADAEPQAVRFLF